jgi:WD40-like Beta Propeller Repeat
VNLVNSTLKYISFLLLATLGLEGYSQFYQGSNIEFGKNRVQYKDFDWFYYPGPHFESYYYIGGENLAEYTLKSCEKNLSDIQLFFDYSIDEKIQVLNYLKQSEYRQSNMGISNDDQYSIGGTARIMGNKMFVYYEGDHALLDLQIRENIARMLFNQMMFGGDWKEVLKSSTMLSIPKWYEEGIVAFAASGQSVEADAFMRDKVSQNLFVSFNRLDAKEGKLAGQAFWNYIAEVYGQTVVPNVLYMAQASRNVESGFLYVLGLTLDEITNDFIKFYKEKTSAIANFDKIPSDALLKQSASEEDIKIWKLQQKLLGDVKVKYKKKYHYSQFRMSPDGENIAYVTNENGQSKVWIYNIANSKAKMIGKYDCRLDRQPDESYPVMAWHPTSKILTYSYEKQARAYLCHYSMEDQKKNNIELFRIEKVIDMQYSDDGKKMIFSGVNRGMTDIYLYQSIGNNQEALTSDIWDDMNPRFADGGRKIIFASDRDSDTLKTKVPVDVYNHKKDIFIYDLETRSKILKRVTATPSSDEHHPAEYSRGKYTYLGDAIGFDNRYMSVLDSAISTVDTTIHYRYFTVSSLLSNYKRNPLDYQVNSRNGNYTLVFKKGSRPIVHFAQSGSDRALSIDRPADGSGNEGYVAPLNTEIFRQSQDSIPQGEIDIDNYVFEDERKDYSYEKESIRVQEIPLEEVKADSGKVDFIMPKSTSYILNFATDYVLTQVGNSFTSAFYQLYSKDNPTSVTPGISGLIKFGASDLFEDYKVVGGFRLGGDFNSNEFGVSFEKLNSRWDKKIVVQRQARYLPTSDTLRKAQTTSAYYQIKYPFNELSSIRITTLIRNDKTTILSTTSETLGKPNDLRLNLGLKVEYVFDNSINKGINLFNGTRFKAWIERYQQPLRYKERSDFNVVGFDFRHYQKIHRDLIAAFRFGGSSSFGYYKLIHYLGGVDNWLFQRVDRGTQVDDTQNYAYQSFSGPVRGFYVNSRNGNSMMMANAEIRFPIFKYFMRKTIKSDFVENFQIVTFLDAGSAWNGRNPYKDNQTFNSTSVFQRPVTVTISNNREPIVYGYGFGLRSRVLGYFVRADWAWGVDDHTVLPRVFYLSLNLDF